jgi:acetyl esterase/lipase
MTFPLFSDSSAFTSIFNSPAGTPPCVATAMDAQTVRLGYYPWLLQSATFLDLLTSHDGLSAKLASLPLEQRAAAIPEDARPLFPHLHADGTFPPTFFVHGTKDSVVPPEESKTMEGLLKEAGVECRMLTIEGGDHGCDAVQSSEEIKGLADVVPFLLAHM